MRRRRSVISRWVASLACGLALACGSETKVDPNATGINLSVGRPDALAVDQLRLRVDGASGTIYGPVFVPEQPVALATVETLVILVGAEHDGETLTISVNGYADGSGVATGATTAVVSARKLVDAVVTLAGETARCGDGACTGSENYCSCAADCAVQCGDGCCTPPERKQNCATDCR